MELSEPYGIYSKNDPQTPEANKDYSMTAPLAKDGSDWPAKGRGTSEIVSALEPVATLVAGKDFSWNLGGTAVHNGGSCQVGMSYDNMKTQVVMASWIGGCPLELPYTFTVPDIPGCDKCLFWWSWFNQSGNREMYQNAAVVTVSGKADSFTGPSAFRSNTFGDGKCENPEGTDVVFPNPGDQVFYGGNYAGSTPSASKIDCDWNNDEQVTVTGSGGSDASDSSGGAGGGGSGGGSSASKGGDSASGGGGGATGGGASGGAGGASSAKETGAAGTSAAGAGAGAGTAGSADGAAATKASSAGSAASTGSSSGSGSGSGAGTGSGAGSGSGSSSGSDTSGSSTTSSSSDNTQQFLYFAFGAVSLILIAGVVICLMQRNKQNAAHSGSSRRSHGGGRGRSRGRRYHDDDSDSTSDDSDDSTGSSDSGYEKRRRRRHH
ncbi:hypothetical protein JCM11641_000139 [Rhodosporidiobolus odoratus]